MRHRPSVMQHEFSQVPSAHIQRSSFNRTCGYKTTFNESYLVPFFVDEVLPGDTFKCNATLFSRLATPIVPFMDNMFLETFYFFVPNRLLWDNWKRFNGEQIDPGDSTDFLVPQITAPAEGFGVGSVYDYMGIPATTPNIKINSLHLRAYHLIWNEFFRDENLQNSLPVFRDDKGEPASTYKLLKRNKRHDYFTSCLPWPQKGPGVELPIGGSAPVNFTDFGHPKFIADNKVQSVLVATNTPVEGNVEVDNKASGYLSWQDLAFKATTDLSKASAVTINALREAFQLQKLFERDARGGTRYTEILRSHFKVISPDSRLQRPEYLGGSSSRININPVEQTSASDDKTPQGNLAAYGLTSNFSKFRKSFTEHGVLIGLLNVRADLTYQKALNRMWSRQTRFDFYWPALSHLGEQAVLNQEIYAQGNADDLKVFGYQERYAEYRYKPSLITSYMNSHAKNSLDVWHLSQKFDSLPKLNSDFITENPPISRVVAVQNEDHFILDAFIELICHRPMPVYSVPELVDHF